ncbi:MAG: hypothetical protein RMK67_02385 [Chloroflexota bacterium]|nr:hypothetical protein [Chloroflexota bacterium]
MIAGPPAPSHLVTEALALGARPRLQISLKETSDPEGDLARARPLFHLLQSHPGKDAVVVTVHTADGRRCQVLFRCRVDRELLSAIAAVMRREKQGVRT